jgi:hypothetical protein
MTALKPYLGQQVLLTGEEARRVRAIPAKPVVLARTPTTARLGGPAPVVPAPSRPAVDPDVPTVVVDESPAPVVAEEATVDEIQPAPVAAKRRGRPRKTE